MTLGEEMTLASRVNSRAERQGKEMGDREGEVRMKIEPKELGSCPVYQGANDLVDEMVSRRIRWGRRERNRER